MANSTKTAPWPGVLDRLARCDCEIALAIAESCQPHTEAEHIGILIWELDWRIERDNILLLSTEACRASSHSLAVVATPRSLLSVAALDVIDGTGAISVSSTASGKRL